MSETVPPVAPGDGLRLVREGGAVIVDVREEVELAQTGKLAGALHIPLGAIEAEADRLPKDRPILLYCRAGVRSAAAGRVLLRMGWPDVLNLGAFEQVAAAGWPVEA